MSNSQVKVFGSNLRRLRWFHWTLAALVSAGLFFSLRGLYYLLEQGGSRSDVKTGFLFTSVMIVIWLRWVLPMFFKHTIARIDGTSILELNTATFVTLDPLPFSSVERVLRRSRYCVELKLKEPTPASFLIVFFRHYSMQDNFTLLADGDELDSLCKALSENGVTISSNTIPDDDPVKLYTIVILILVLVFVFVLFVEKLTALLL